MSIGVVYWSESKKECVVFKKYAVKLFSRNLMEGNVLNDYEAKFHRFPIFTIRKSNGIICNQIDRQQFGQQIL